MLRRPLQPVLVTTTVGNRFDLKSVYMSPDDAAFAVSMVLRKALLSWHACYSMLAQWPVLLFTAACDGSDK
jgi:hypothetical protein